MVWQISSLYMEGSRRQKSLELAAPPWSSSPLPLSSVSPAADPESIAGSAGCRLLNVSKCGSNTGGERAKQWLLGEYKSSGESGENVKGTVEKNNTYLSAGEQVWKTPIPKNSVTFCGQKPAPRQQPAFAVLLFSESFIDTEEHVRFDHVTVLSAWRCVTVLIWGGTHLLISEVKGHAKKPLYLWSCWERTTETAQQLVAWLQ